MHVIVCVKQILDPEIPPMHFQIDTETKTAVRDNAALVMSTFDECALELALQIRDSHPDTTVSVVSLGPPEVEDVLRHAFAMRCDHAVRINIENLDEIDAMQVAGALTKGIQQLEPADLVLFGREAGDWGCGQVGTLAASLLERPVLSNVAAIEVEESLFIAKRFGEQGWERFEVEVPAVMTVTNAEENVPRFPTVRDKMQARRKKIEVIEAEELFSGILSPAVTVEELFVPESNAECYVVPGDSPDEKVEGLLHRLRELKVL